MNSAPGLHATSKSRSPRSRAIIFAAILAAYGVFSLWSLAWFPFVHSDEAWLASLSRSMLTERSIAATEDFFVLTPRYPHAIKVIFHLLQIPLLAVSFNPTSVRLLSWAAGMGAVVATFFAARAIVRPDDSKLARICVIAAPVALVMVDAQLLATFHTARQEAVLVFIFTVALAGFFRSVDLWSRRNTVILGIMLGLCGGIHPNAFVIGLPFIPLLLTLEPGSAPGGRFCEALLLTGILAAFAALFVGLSFGLDSGFLTNYSEFGRSVGVGDNLIRRFARYRNFFVKLAGQIAGTYYLPPIRAQLWLFATAGAVGITVIIVSLVGSRVAGRRVGGHNGATSHVARHARPTPSPRVMTIARLLIVILSVLSALFIIGKFSPPSIVFLFPPAYLLIGALLGLVPRLGALVRRGAFAWGVLVSVLAVGILCVSAWTTGQELGRWSRHSYDDYSSVIARHVTPEDTVLANLNLAFALDAGQLRTWRDLARLDDSGLTFDSFIREHDVRYIFYPDELDLIYEQRPVWNDVYGNLYPYFSDMKEFLRLQCELVEVIEAPFYAMRLLPYMAVDENERPALLSVYRVREADDG